MQKRTAQIFTTALLSYCLATKVDLSFKFAELNLFEQQIFFIEDIVFILNGALSWSEFVPQRMYDLLRKRF